MSKVVHCKREKYDVYIGRPSKWGNPFVIGPDGTREEVIAKHWHWLYRGKGRHLIKDLHELEGKTLGCWCHNQPCHGDNYIKMIEIVRKIPKGIYCYDEHGRCPYWSVVHEHVSMFDNYEPVAYCSFIGKDDRELGGGLLWDQCKECGIKDDIGEL